ncbi:MAG: hypothetical protein IPM39_27335 [Chloroflexi bacterium]|nr:hypothetical protein [Chloroflexota bacterium]
MKTTGLCTSFYLLLALLLAACAAETPPPAGACQPDAHGLIPLPTRALGADPDLMQPPPAGGQSGGGECLPADTLPLDDSLAFSAAPLRNESLDIADQQLLAAAVGDDVLALAWLTAGDLTISVARGGSFLQARRIAPAVHADLVFSAVNRLHLVYEQDGQIHYRAADLGARQADFDFWRQVGPGHKPRITLDANNRAHVFYELDGAIWHAEHQHDLYWHIARIGPGHTPRLTTFYDNPATPNTNERGFALSYLEGNILHLRTYGMTPLLLPGWTTVAQLSLAEMPMTAVTLHSARAADGTLLLAAAWVSHIPAPPPPPVPVPPTYTAVNPLSPFAVVHPERIYDPFNAARMAVTDAVFDGGLMQTVYVTPGAAVTFSAYGRAWSSDADDPLTVVNPANLRLQIGLDPAGGTNPNGAGVLWSAEANPLNQYVPLAVSGTAVSNSVTLFLRARPDAIRAHNEAVWDGAELSGGALVNGRMDTFTNGIPDGWTPFYEDSGAGGVPPRDRYTAYAAWSADGGQSWTGPVPVSENRLPGQGLTGALGPDAYPFVSIAGTEPTLHVFAIYASGDPPPGTTFIRYGRPVVVGCALATGSCDEPPGVVLAADTPPAADLILAAHPLQARRALLAWSGLQTDYVSRDVYAAGVKLERERELERELEEE